MKKGRTKVRSAILFILTFIIPFAVTSYFPASYLLGKGNFELGFFFPIIVSVIGLSVSYFFWKIGLKHYESAGS